MTWTQKKQTISGNMVVDGSLEAKHIKANTITANKFSGAVEEENWAYTNDEGIGFSYSTYYTAHTFNFPATELGLIKGRHVTYMGEAYLNTSTSTEYKGLFKLRLEAKVPSTDTSTLIGTATHRATTGNSEQIVSFSGNVASNRIGSGGSIGTQYGSYRTYENLYYDPKGTQGSDLVTNGNFNSGTTNWTIGAGSHSSGYGAYSLNTTGATDFDAYSYQAITTVVGQSYNVTADITNGTADGQVRVTSSTALSADNLIAHSGIQTGAASVDFSFVATGTTTYIMLTGWGTTSNQYVGFDNIVVKQNNPETYLRVSTTGGALVPTNGTADLYYHPYSGATAGSWQVVDEYNTTTVTRPFGNHFPFTAQAYIGHFNENIELRLRALNTIATGKSIVLNNVKIFMQSRIVE